MIHNNLKEDNIIVCSDLETSHGIHKRIKDEEGKPYPILKLIDFKLMELNKKTSSSSSSSSSEEEDDEKGGVRGTIAYLVC
jgi:hypothetical protein